MSITSHLIQRLLKLPPPATRRLVVQRDLRVRMADGVELLADRWLPRHGAESLPTARDPHPAAADCSARWTARRSPSVGSRCAAASVPAARSDRYAVPRMSRRLIGS